jgi:hypothetical protein
MTCLHVMLMLSALGAPGEASAGGPVQDRFVVGFWLDPPLEDAHYRDIAEAHFNLVIGNVHADTVERMEKQLALCEKHGLDVLLMAVNIGTREMMPFDQLPDGPACLGYGLYDEPSADEFPMLAEKVAELRRVRPGKPAYINLFPSYASPWGQLGTETYDEYVRLFIETVKPEVLSMDHYPQFQPDHDGRDGYCADLAVMRKYSLGAGISFWNFFNIMPYGSHTDPTEAQVRWQVFSSLAYGARGVLYFCYFTPEGDEFPKGGAIIHRDGRKSAHYGHAQRMNLRLKHLGPVLMRLTSTGVHRVGPEDDPAAVLAGSPLRDISRTGENDPAPDYLVGAFTHEDGRRAVLINNYRHNLSAWPTVVFDAPEEEVREIDQQTGEEIPLRDDSPDIAGVQIALEDGAGRLFLMP